MLCVLQADEKLSQIFNIGERREACQEKSRCSKNVYQLSCEAFKNERLLYRSKVVFRFYNTTKL